MGAIYGTPAYMAPEQAMGKPIDHRVDLYAVGVMLHEMIAARPPFDGDGIMLLAQQVNEPPPPLVSPLGEGLVTPEIAEFVGRLLAKAPADRFDSASAAVAAIDAMRSPDRLPASAASPRPPPVPLARPAEQPTLAGTVAGAANTAAPSVAGRAATGSGPKRAASASTIAAERLASVRAGATRVVERAARRVGLPTRTLVAITAGAVALLVLSLLLVALRTSPPSEQEERAKRPRPRSGPTASTTTATPTATAEPPSATTADPATPAATPTTSAKSAGGGIKGIGRKIKGLF
jgi:serine/threonine-protein kinase